MVLGAKVRRFFGTRPLFVNLAMQKYIFSLARKVRFDSPRKETFRTYFFFDTLILNSQLKSFMKKAQKSPNGLMKRPLRHIRVHPIK